MRNFTVIMIYKETGQVCADLVENVDDGETALAIVANNPERAGATILLAIEGDTDGKLTFAEGTDG